MAILGVHGESLRERFDVKTVFEAVLVFHGESLEELYTCFR
jgi:hypothetical protein